LAALAAAVRLTGVGRDSLGSYFGYAQTSTLILDLLLLVVLAQNLTSASSRVGNPPFWSLALEEQLYILYFPLLAIRRRLGWRWALAIVVAVTLGWRGWRLLHPELPEQWNLLGPARWLEWTLGAVAVEAHLGRVKLPSLASSLWVAGAALGVGVAIAPPFHAWPTIPGASLVNDVIFSFAGFVLVNACCRADREGRIAGNRIALAFARLGVMSYSLYLVHFPVMAVTKRFALMLGLRSVSALLACRFGAALLAAYAFFRLVESHFLNASRAKAVRSDRATARQSLDANQ
jgi:peptidoglycan/LPS O-acetylase OafA/YrhL